MWLFLTQIRKWPGAEATAWSTDHEEEPHGHTRESSAPHAHPSTEEQDHPHACLEGYIYLGYTAFDEQTGEEVERVEALPCRRCAGEDVQA